MKPDRNDLIFLAVLLVLFLLTSRRVRADFISDPATGESIVGRLARDFAAAGAVYLGFRLALRTRNVYAIGAAAALLAFSVAGGWIRRLLEGRTGGGAPN